jgi:uncharacterized protein (TIGR02246 family)
MKKLTSAAALATGLLALAACQPAAVDTSAIAAEIVASTDDWETAFNSGDVDTLVGFYTADAVVMPHGSKAAAGTDAIREMIAQQSSMAQANGLTLNIDGATAGVSGDTAWHHGSYTFTDASGAVVASGNYVDVRRNVDGKWLSSLDIWNSDQSPAPPAADAAAAPAT